MKEIVQKDNPVLREKAEEIPTEDITSKKIQSLLKDMREALEEKAYGVALAAPQIGVPLRVFIVANKVFTEEEREKNNFIYINPKIIKTSGKKDVLEEACLSVEGYYGTTTRAQQVTVEAYDEHGIKFTRGSSGLLAQIFQHETDHLNGILYIDHASDIQKMEPKKDE